MGLIRERYGVRWGAFAVVLMLVANLGSTVAEFAGIGAALGLFGVPAAAERGAGRGHRGAASSPRAASGGCSTCSWPSASSCRRPTSSRRSWPSPTGARRSMRSSSRSCRRRRSTGWRSWARWAPRSRPGARPSSSPTRSTSACGRRTCRRAASTSSPGALLTNVIAAFIVIACAATLYQSGSRPSPDAAAGRHGPGAAGRAGRHGAVRRGAAGGFVPGPRRGAADERLLDVRGLRLGDRRRLELARGAGLLRPARLLHRRSRHSS